MSQVEIIKSRIIDVGSNGHGHRRSSTAITLQAQPVTQSITTFAWNTSPVSIVEEVELPARLDSRLVVLGALIFAAFDERVFAARDAAGIIEVLAEVPKHSNRRAYVAG